MSSRPYVINRLIWMLILVLACIDATWLTAIHVKLDVSGIFIVFYIMLGCAAISLFYRYIRPDLKLYLLGQITGQMLASAAVLGILSYATSVSDAPLRDSALIAIDETMGFDWRHYLDVVAASPNASHFFHTVYLSSGPQILFIMVALFLIGKTEPIQRFMLAFIITSVITIALAALWPAMGGFTHYAIDLVNYPAIDPIGALSHAKTLLALRSHTLTTFSFPMEGVVMFPSFHSALSILLVYAGWPLRWLRAPLLLLNMYILLSTPVIGGHYLSDVLAGIAIGIAAIAATQWLLNRSWVSTMKGATPPA